MKKFILLAVAVSAVSSCGIIGAKKAPERTTIQAAAPVENPAFCVPGVSCNRAAIVNDPNVIVLSAESQSEQERSRKIYAERQAQIAAQRVVINDVSVPDTPTINVAEYARKSTNPIGVKMYNRSGFGSSKCRRYNSATDAQRAFLANGGPSVDPQNLDKDGDGYACGFNPTPYRNLNVALDSSPWKK